MFCPLAKLNRDKLYKTGYFTLEKKAKRGSDRPTLKWIGEKSRGQTPKIIAVTVSDCLGSAIYIFLAFLCRNIIDGAQAGDRDKIIVNAVLMTGAVLARILFYVLSNLLSASAKYSLEKSYRTQILNSLVRKSYAVISAYHSGEVVNRLFSDVGEVSSGVTESLPVLFGTITRLVCAVVALGIMSLKFMLLFAAVGVVVFFATGILRKHIKRLHLGMQKSRDDVHSFVQETSENLLAVKVFGAEDKILARAEILQQKNYNASLKKQHVGIFANTAMTAVFSFGYVFSVLWGARGIFLGTLTYGTVIAVFSLVSQVQTPFVRLSGFLPKYYSALASAERLIELENLPDDVAGEEIDRDYVYENLQSIKFEDVRFSYGREQVLRGLSFTLEKGDCMAVCGLSGGGKSTLFLVLLSVFRPQSGRVRIDYGDKEEDISPDYKRLFAYVPQGNNLFSGTIRDNLTFIEDNCTEDDIKAALETACAQFVYDLPEGLETVLSERGAGLSEGQRQRIAVARALLSGAPILLLDECTSALDEPTEAALLENLKKLKNKTCLVVTHRRAALSICNKKLELSDGTGEVVRL